jgi:exodeoxyribonuclease VII large subunit
MTDLQKTYTVTEINSLAKSLLERELGFVRIEGEISGLTKASSGHYYFSLKDKASQLRCAMFKMAVSQSRCEIKEGAQVKATGKISLYTARGEYQYIVEHLEALGQGDLFEAFLKLKEKLFKEGLFDEKRKRPLPLFPRTIGLITSPSGAVVHDMIKIFKRRAPFISLIIYPTLVQGSEAPALIRKALALANSRQECDLLILARGGGSLEDLFAFNDEALARDISQSAIPLISAVGHEVDFTIADFVADLRAPTPSAAAEMASPDRFSLLQKIDHFSLKIQKNILSLLKEKQLALQNLSKRLIHPKKQLELLKEETQELEKRLLRSMLVFLSDRKTQASYLEKQLRALSPMATLERGYVILKKDDKLITSVNNLHVHDHFVAITHAGDIHASVDKIILKE